MKVRLKIYILLDYIQDINPIKIVNQTEERTIISVKDESNASSGNSGI